MEHSYPEFVNELRVRAIFAENARFVFREHLRRPTATSPAAQPQPGPGWWSWLTPAPEAAFYRFHFSTN